MQKVAFHTLGCKVNQYETEAITEQFIASGYQVVGFEDKADIYIVNTCTVTNIADKKSRKMLSKAKKLNNESVVVAVGCYVQVAHEQLEQIPFIDVLIGNTHKNQVVEIVEKFIESNQSYNSIESVHKDIVYEELSIKSQQSKTRTTIKIQDGCNQYCTYCIIPYTRGIIRSRQPISVIDEVRVLASKGYKEIILTGIHLGSYGKDLEDIELVDLVEELDKIKGIERIRLGSLEPNYITEGILERLIKCPSVCNHFHLSMQSGSDNVLKRMKRRYTTAEYYEKVQLIRKFYKEAAITTDVIVGFPMETVEEENETFNFVKKIGFSELHIFKYSMRKGTVAANMKPQINGTVKHLRSRRLTDLAISLKTSYLKSFLNKQLEVLLEDDVIIDGVSYMTGYSNNYIKVYINSENNGNLSHNQIVKTTMKELFEEGLLATAY